MMVSRETIERIVTAVLLAGFGAFSLGFIVWVCKLLMRYNSPLEIHLIFIGIYFMVVASIAALLLSKLLEV